MKYLQVTINQVLPPSCHNRNMTKKLFDPVNMLHVPAKYELSIILTVTIHTSEIRWGFMPPSESKHTENHLLFLQSVDLLNHQKSFLLAAAGPP